MPLPPPASSIPTRRRRSARAVAGLCALSMLLTAAGPVARAQSPNPLPSLGDSVSEDLSVGTERQIGEQIMREIRRDPDYLDDPVLLEYLQSIWKPLLVAARERGNVAIEIDLRYTFEPFLVRDRSVNAFALPGGFVGVHLGLMAITATPDELAAVLAHELSHVTQRHIARSIAPSRQASILAAAAAILGMLAASRAGSGDVGQAVMAGGQAAAIQSQLNFSRDMEREADRVGFGVLTQAGYAPAGMAGMFEKLDKASRLNDSGNFPYLRTHPLTVERIGEARMRVDPTDLGKWTGSLLEHATMQARARVLMDPRTDALRRLQGLDANAAPAPIPEAVRVPDPKAQQLPGVLVVSPLGREAERLAAAYASALSSTLLRDWVRADAAMATALQIVQGPTGGDVRATRSVRLLAAESMLARGDSARAMAALAPLGAEGSRPVLLLKAQIAIGAPARPGAPAPAAEAGGSDAAALQRSAEALQTWVANNPRDAVAWRTLGQVWARLGQPLRELRAEAEAHLAEGDLQGAVERLRAAQRLARSGVATDFIESSVIDSRLRDIEAQRRALMAAEGRKKGEPAQ